MKQFNPTKIQELINEALIFCRSKDETRPYLSGIVHYSHLNARVSCDGHKLAVTTLGYSEALKDLILMPDFTVLNREYPRLQTIIPDHTKLTKATIHFPKMYAIKSKAPTYLYFDGSKFSLERSDNTIMALDTNNLLNFLKTDCLFNVAFNSNNSVSPFMISFLGKDLETDDFKNFQIVMPLKMKD